MWLGFGHAAGCAGDGDAKQAAPTQDVPPPEPWRSDEAAAYAEAKKSRRHVVVDFRATWCEPCKKVEAILAKDEVYAELTKSFVPLEFDITALTANDNAIKAKHRVFNLPAVLFLNAAGEELGRFEGEKLTEAAFLAEVRRVVDEHPTGS